jgi:phage-related protein
VLTVTNLGTTNSRPVLTISGPCINPTVQNVTEGKMLSFVTTLLVGDQLVIDLGSKAVTLNGLVSRRGAVTSSPDQWWDLQPGANTIRFATGDSGNTGSTLSVSWASAWV